MQCMGKLWWHIYDVSRLSKTTATVMMGALEDCLDDMRSSVAFEVGGDVFQALASVTVPYPNA
jgi:hypothetical protein